MFIVKPLAIDEMPSSQTTRPLRQVRKMTKNPGFPNAPAIRAARIV